MTKNFCLFIPARGSIIRNTYVTYAIGYKFYKGSLIDFASKKRRLLLESDENMSVNIQIVISLSNFVQNKLKRKSIVNIECLMSKLKQFGRLNDEKNDIVNKKLCERKTCRICERLGFKNRFHAESVCFNKDRKTKNENVRISNNNEIQEVVASCEKAKNE